MCYPKTHPMKQHPGPCAMTAWSLQAHKHHCVDRSLQVPLIYFAQDTQPMAPASPTPHAGANLSATPLALLIPLGFKWVGFQPGTVLVRVPHCSPGEAKRGRGRPDGRDAPCNGTQLPASPSCQLLLQPSLLLPLRKRNLYFQSRNCAQTPPGDL